MISIIDDVRSIREAVRSLIRSLGHEAVAFFRPPRSICALIALPILNA